MQQHKSYDHALLKELPFSGKRDLFKVQQALIDKVLAKTASRRDALALGLSAFTTVPLWGPLARAANLFSLSVDGRTAKFSLGQIDLFHLRTDLFDGRPRLSVKQRQNAFSIRLDGARFPGTLLPADMLLAASRTSYGWQGRLQVRSIRFDASFPFEQWLIGRSVANSSFILPFPISVLKGAAITLQGDNEATFYPDWTFRVRGKAIGRLASPLGHVSANTVQIEIIPPESPSLLLTEQGVPKTRLWLSGEGRSMRSVPMPPAAVQIPDGPIDGFVELLTSFGEPKYALAVEAKEGSGGHLSIGPAEHGGVSVRQAYLSMRGEGDEKCTELVADLAQSCAWVCKGSIHAELRLSNGEPFRLRQEGTCLCKFPENVKVTRIVVPFSHVDEAMFCRRTSELTSSYPGLDDLDWLNGFHPLRRAIPLGPFDLLLRRAEDGLSLVIRFHSMQLVDSWKGLTLEPSGQDPMIEYDFGPQYIQEEALYVTDVPKSCSSLDTYYQEDAYVFLTDKQIVKLYNRTHKSITQEELCKARKGKGPYSFQDIRQAAIKKYLSSFDDKQEPTDLSRARARFANSTWLTFDVVVKSLPLSLDALMAWAKPELQAGTESPFRMRVSKLAAPFDVELASQVDELKERVRNVIKERPRSLREPRPAGSSESRHYKSLIEVPYRVGLSTISAANWRTPGTLHTGQRSSELWHIKAENIPMRVVWTPDFQPDNILIERRIPHYPQDKADSIATGRADFRTSLDARDRHELMALTSGFGQPALLGSEQVVPVTDELRAKLRLSKTEGIFVPKPLDAKLLILTGLGAITKLKGSWSPPASSCAGALTIQRWHHDVQIGRDSKVVVEYKGFLFPIGHPAVLVKETERHLILAKKGKVCCTTARLVQRFFIKVPAFLRTFPAVGQPFNSRAWPFTKLASAEFTTPDLDPPEQSAIVDQLGQQGFWPKANGQLIEFPFTDVTSSASFRTPLVFIDNEVSHNPGLLKAVSRTYRMAVDKARGVVAAHSPGQWQSSLLNDSEKPRECIATVMNRVLPYVPSVKAGESDYETGTFLLDFDLPPFSKEAGRIDETCLASTDCSLLTPLEKGMEETYWEEVLKEGNDIYLRALRISPAMEAQNQPPFYPHLRQALIVPRQLATISGQSTAKSLVEYDGTYLRDGFSSNTNPGEVFLRFVSAGGADLLFSRDTSANGGFVCAETGIAAISRKRGLIGGNTEGCVPQITSYRYESAARFHGEHDKDPVSSARLDTFDPREFFKKTCASAKLCGCVSLCDIVDVVQNAPARIMPQIVQEALQLITKRAVPALVKGALELVEPEQIEARIAVKDALSKLPALQAQARKLRAQAEYLSSVSQDPAKLGPASLEFVKAAKTFIDTVRNMADEPLQLLPPDAAIILSRLDNFRSAAKELLSENSLRAAFGDIRRSLTSSIKPELNRIEEIIKGHPRYYRMLEVLATVKEGIDKIETALQSDKQDFVIDAARQMRLIVGSLREIINLSQVPSESLCKTIATANTRLIADFGAWSTVLKKDAVRLKEDTDKVSEQFNAQREKLSIEIASALRIVQEAAAAAVRHGEDISKVFDSRDVLFPSSGGLCEGLLAPQHAAITGALFRAALDLWRKSSRLSHSIDQLRRGASKIRTEATHAVTDLESSIQVYAKSTFGIEIQNTDADRCGNPGLMEKYLQAIVSEFQVLQASTTDNRTKRLTDWVGSNTKAGISVLAELRKCNGDVFVGILERKLQSIDKVESATTIILLVLNSSKHTARELQKAALALIGKLENDVVRPLGALCSKLSATVRNIDETISKAIVSVKTPPLQDWLPDATLSCLESLKAEIESIKQCPDEGDDAVRYLESFIRAYETIQRLLSDISRAFDRIDYTVIAYLRKNADRLLRDILALPTKFSLAYDWNTQVQAYPGGAGAVFEPLDQQRLTIHSRIVIDPAKGERPETQLKATLSRFKINLLGNAPFLSIWFHPLTFTAASGDQSRLDVRVDHVELNGQLNFVKDLQNYIGGESGVFMEPTFSPVGVRVGYRFSKDVIQLAAFTLQNVAFSMACVLPFDNSPLRVRFSFAEPTKPFLLSVGIYGGGGYVAIQSLADRIELLEMSFEYGLVTAFSFGPAKGTGRITAGVYIRLAAGNALVAGFFNASGNASIAGLITVDAVFRVQLLYYIDEERIRGEATFQIAFRIAFIKYSFSVSVAYERKGASKGQESGAAFAYSAGAGTRVVSFPSTGRDQIQRIEDTPEKDLSRCMLEPETWKEYWAAFAEEAYVCK